MTDRECVQFLQWSLPQLRMRWNGYRKVRGQVCKRIDRRVHELGLTDAVAYRSWLEVNRDEWHVLDSFCRVTISRFYRDREVFQALEREVLVRLSESARARGTRDLRCWSIGCASGEEPYTLAILWDLGPGRLFPSMTLSIVASDADKTMIERARVGRYAAGSLLALPQDWKIQGFIRERGEFSVRPEKREKVTFIEQDVRNATPDGLFDLILCRNLVFTYFDLDLQQDILATLRDKLHDHGVLVVGTHEVLPSGNEAFLPWKGCPAVYRKRKTGNAIRAGAPSSHC